MELKIMSFNIRCCDDPNGNSIRERAPRLKTVISKYDPDVIGFQEYRPDWEKHIDELFPEYEIFNKYRSSTDPESAPILYRKDMFEEKGNGYFWLSDTPDIESSGYDVLNYERMCEYVVLEHRESGKQFLFSSTHFGFGDDGQIKSAKLISQRLLDFDMPIAIVGDFNMLMDSPAYSEFTKSFKDINVMTSKDFGVTYHGYHLGNDDNMHIDYCFVNGFTPVEQKIVRDTVDGMYPSDHFGIFALLKL